MVEETVYRLLAGPSATAIQRHLVAAAIPHLTPAGMADMEGVRGDPCQTEDEAERSAVPRQQKGVALPSWPAWPSIGATWASLVRLHSSWPGRARRSEMFKRHRKFRRGLALLGGTDGFQGGHALSNGKRTKSGWR